MLVHMAVISFSSNAPTYEYATITDLTADEHVSFSHIFAIAKLLLRMTLHMSSGVHMYRFL